MSAKFNKYVSDITAKEPFLVETGFSNDVIKLAKFIACRGGSLASVDLDMDRLNLIHTALEIAQLAPFASLHFQDPQKFLGSKNWLDAAFLNHRGGLVAGLAQFKLAMSAGAQLIVMTNYQTDAAWAVQFAKLQKWNVEHENGYSFLTRP